VTIPASRPKCLVGDPIWNPVPKIAPVASMFQPGIVDFGGQRIDFVGCGPILAPFMGQRLFINNGDFA
jgi:hypothetical protein